MGIFHGVLFEFMPGKRLEFNELDAIAIERWGRALAQIHQASQGYKISGRMDPSSQIDMIRQIMPKSETTVWKEVDAAEELLRGLPASDENYGLIHFDFELDNLAWKDDEIGCFDLDDCAYEWFVMDISNAIMRELFDNQIERFDLTEKKLQLFLKGYRSVRRLDDEELKWLPLFLRFDNLITFARVYRSIAEGPEGQEPEWTVELRRKLSRELDKLRRGFQFTPIQEGYHGASYG
jgi:Ser/Thr protein kinase RdoA (MazF antagonist)